MNNKPVFEYIRGMRSDLSQMEEKGTVDASFIQKIETLDKEFTEMKQYWIAQKAVSVGSAFVFYSAMHNTNLVLGKMKNRFKNAKKVNDNPEIACDSLLVMPIISEVHQKTTRAIEEKQNMNPFLVSNMLNLVSTLRTTAKLASLLPTPAEEIKTTDNNQLKQTATELDIKFVVSNLLNDI